MNALVCGLEISAHEYAARTQLQRSSRVDLRSGAQEWSR